MDKSRSARLFACMLLSVLSCGCVSLHWSKPTEILVIDAETNEPISNAHIDIDYQRGLLIGSTDTAFVVNVPRDRQMTTDRLGKAILSVSNYKNESWKVSAAGYFDRHSGHALFGSKGFVPENFRNHPNEDGVATIRMYRNQEPTYTVVVPDGYVGPIFVEEVAFESGVPETVGQRKFEYTINQNGYVRVNFVPLACEPLGMIDMQFKHENGTPVRREGFSKSSDNDVVLRYVTLGVYVVGTAADHSRIHRQVYHYIDGSPNHISPNHEELERIFEQAKGIKSVSAPTEYP